jgi:hypothetical protein
MQWHTAATRTCAVLQANRGLLKLVEMTASLRIE